LVWIFAKEVYPDFFSFRSLVGEKMAPLLGKEGQVRLENIDVSQNHIKRRIVEDPNRLCFEVFQYLKLDRAGMSWWKRLGAGAMKSSPLIS
jgi:hypothetical protein